MRTDTTQAAMDAQIAASSVADRVEWLRAMREAALRMVWQQVGDAGIEDPVDQAEFLLRRLYPEQSEAWFAQVIEQLRAAQAAGTWSGFQRPDA